MKLKPCPCCGRTDEVEDGPALEEARTFMGRPVSWLVRCDGCGTEGPANMTPEGAVKNWNEMEQDND